MKKTSIQLDPPIKDVVLAMYPELNISEIIRLSLEYVIESKPVLHKAKFAKFGGHNGTPK